VKDDLFGRQRIAGAKLAEIDSFQGIERLCVDPIGDDIDLVHWRLKVVGELLTHILGANDHAPGFVGELPLDVVDGIGLRAGKLTSPPAALSGVDRRHHGQPIVQLEGPRSLRGQPVVVVEQIKGTAVANEALAVAGQHLVADLHLAHEIRSAKG